VDKLVLLERYNSRLLALERRSPLTAETYRFEISRFLDWLTGEGLSLQVNLPLHDITRYLTYRRTIDGITSRSVAKAISALRSFFRFLADECKELTGQQDAAQASASKVPDVSADASALMSLVQIPKHAERLPLVHSKEDVERLLSCVDTNTPLGIRNRALYELIYSAGLRISEAVALNSADIFISRRLARVTGKGDKERLVVFGDHAAHWLTRYIQEARQKLLGKRNGKALFVNKSGKRLSRKGIWKNYCGLALQAGLGTKLHTLRHTFATELLSGGADLRSVQELLGHANITTTQIYTHIDQKQLKDNHRKYLPKLKSWSES